MTYIFTVHITHSLWDSIDFFFAFSSGKKCLNLGIGVRSQPGGCKDQCPRHFVFSAIATVFSANIETNRKYCSCVVGTFFKYLYSWYCYPLNYNRANIYFILLSLLLAARIKYLSHKLRFIICWSAKRCAYIYIHINLNSNLFPLGVVFASGMIRTIYAETTSHGVANVVVRKRNTTLIQKMIIVNSRPLADYSKFKRFCRIMNNIIFFITVSFA